MPYKLIKDGQIYIAFENGMQGLEKELALTWNARICPENRKTRAITLSKIVKKFKDEDKQRILRIWDRFHAAYGFGNKIPEHMIFDKEPILLSSCSDDWLSHHGLPLNA